VVKILNYDCWNRVSSRGIATHRSQVERDDDVREFGTASNVVYPEECGRVWVMAAARARRERKGGRYSPMLMQWSLE